MRFFRDGYVNLPRRRHAIWFLAQYVRFGYLPPTPPTTQALADEVILSDLYAEVAEGGRRHRPRRRHGAVHREARQHHLRSVQARGRGEPTMTITPARRLDPSGVAASRPPSIDVRPARDSAAAGRARRDARRASGPRRRSPSPSRWRRRAAAFGLGRRRRRRASGRSGSSISALTEPARAGRDARRSSASCSSTPFDPDGPAARASACRCGTRCARCSRASRIAAIDRDPARLRHRREPPPAPGGQPGRSSCCGRCRRWRGSRSG